MKCGNFDKYRQSENNFYSELFQIVYAIKMFKSILQEWQ